MTAAAAKSTTKTGIIWNIVCVLVCIILIPFIACSIYLSVATRKNPDKLATIFGVTPVVVLSGSMEPVFYEGDLIYLETVDVDDLKAKEDIVCFKDGESFVTHRITRIEIVDGEKRFYTQGDFNDSEDKNYILADQIQGKYKGRVPKLGAVILFIQDPYGLVLTMILLLLLYIAGELIIEILEKRKTNKTLLVEIERLKALLEEKERVLAQADPLREALTASENQISEQATLLAERERTIARQEQSVQEKETMLAEQERLLLVKENTIAEQERRVQEKDDTIADLEGLLAEREKMIMEQGKRLAEQEYWISTLQPKPTGIAMPKDLAVQAQASAPTVEEEREAVLQEKEGFVAYLPPSFEETSSVSAQENRGENTGASRVRKLRRVRILSVHNEGAKVSAEQLLAKFKK